jgi:ADP-ribose pyrophosphatase YjhB (NUDIX family)
MAFRGATVDELESLYRADLSRFIRAAAAIVGDEATGRDAVQEAFAQPVKKRASFKGEAALEAWVWRIVINEALALRRRRGQLGWSQARRHVVPGRRRKGRLPWIGDNRRLYPMSTATTEIIARAVIRRDGHVLLARTLAEPWWFLPGGHVEPGEPIELALIREIAEELGTEARIDGLLAVVENRWSDSDSTHHELNLVFEATILGAEPESRERHLEFRWLPLDQVADAEVRPAAIKRIIGHKRGSELSGAPGTAESPACTGRAAFPGADGRHPRAFA